MSNSNELSTVSTYINTRFSQLATLLQYMMWTVSLDNDNDQLSNVNMRVRTLVAELVNILPHSGSALALHGAYVTSVQSQLFFGTDV